MSIDWRTGRDTWWKLRSVDDQGSRFRISHRVDEPGHKGYKLFDGDRHVSTHKLLRDAKAYAERLL